MELARLMRFAGGAYDAAQMRCLSALSRELGAIALGRGPLVAKNVWCRRFAIRCEQVDETKGEKSALAQAHLG